MYKLSKGCINFVSNKHEIWLELLFNLSEYLNYAYA